VSSSLGHVLLGDIGATNARFAMLANGLLGPVVTFEAAKFARFDDVVAVLLKDPYRKATISLALFAVAGPVEDERSALTNCSWIIDAHELRKRFNLDVRVLNDFEATAHSLPALMAADLFRIGGGQARTGASMVVLGPGTGLGVAGLCPNSDGPIAITSEGGHATLAATCDREEAILNHLRCRFGHVSAERAISGEGLENLYQAIVELDRIDIASRNAAEITKNALGGCPTATAALEMFCSFLGAFAGNVALTFAARGGVYIAGGIAPRIVDFIARSEFRRRFEAKGRFRAYLELIPSHVIVHPAATLLGLKALVERCPAPVVALTGMRRSSRASSPV